MTTLILVRHATTAATGKRLGGWTPGVHLDARGHDQAACVAAQLAPLPISAVYTSPLERTVETARRIAREQRLRVRVRKGLGEVDYGDWTDRPLGQLRRRTMWRDIQSTPSRVTFPNGESIRAAQQRAVDTIEQLVADHGDATIVAVSHADVIKAVVAFYLGLGLDMFQRLHIAPASVTTVHLPTSGHPMLVACNVTSHLPQRTSDA
ncbi:MAG: MSMEG_4193 family putative phosphomutase [Nitriliruptoraceae bacterium]